MIRNENLERRRIPIEASLYNCEKISEDVSEEKHDHATCTTQLSVATRYPKLGG